MLMLPDPKRLMFAYLLGAYTTSITTGLVIVFSLDGSGAVATSKHTVSPAQDLAFGLVLLVTSFVLGTGRDEPVRRRRRERKERDTRDPEQGWSQRMLGRGSARITYAVGVALSFPGFTYLVALHRLAVLDPGIAATIALVLAFCVIQLLLLEVPLFGYVIAPEATQERVVRFRAWLARSSRRAAVIGAASLGLLLVARGIITLL
jgi:hypothetical protein